MLILAGLLSIGAFLRGQETGLKGKEAPFEVVTPWGTFAVEREQAEHTLHFHLRWNGKVLLDEDDDSEVSVVSDSGAGPDRLMLLAFGSQGEACPAVYRVLDFSVPEPFLSKEFGNCSDEPLVHAGPHSSALSSASSDLPGRQAGRTRRVPIVREPWSKSTTLPG